MEKLLAERRTTISYKLDNVFRKYYKYASEQEVLNEIYCSELALSKGINTPQFIRTGYNTELSMFYVDYKYVNIKAIDRRKVDFNTVSTALKIVDLLESLDFTSVGSPKKYKNDMTTILSYLPASDIKDYLTLIDKAFSENCYCFTHGDFSFENIGWDVDKNKLILYDFQNSCQGIKDWDKAYLLASIPSFYFYNLLPKEKQYLIKLIAALKYARGERKQLEVAERRAIYEFWWS